MEYTRIEPWRARNSDLGHKIIARQDRQWQVIVDSAIWFFAVWTVASGRPPKTCSCRDEVKNMQISSHVASKRTSIALASSLLYTLHYLLLWVAPSFSNPSIKLSISQAAQPSCNCTVLVQGSRIRQTPDSYGRVMLHLPWASIDTHNPCDAPAKGDRPARSTSTWTFHLYIPNTTM